MQLHLHHFQTALCFRVHKKRGQVLHLHLDLNHLNHHYMLVDDDLLVTFLTEQYVQKIYLRGHTSRTFYQKCVSWPD